MENLRVRDLIGKREKIYWITFGLGRAEKSLYGEQKPIGPAT